MGEPTVVLYLKPDQWQAKQEYGELNYKSYRHD
jgi:hypothetical protein